MVKPLTDVTSSSPTYSDENWRSVVQRLSQLLLFNGLTIPTDDDIISGNVKDFFTHLNTISAPSRQTDLSSVSPSGYNFWAVEMLMEQAATLLDRAADTDSRHFTIRVAQFNILSELCQFFALDVINRQEIQDGIYDIAGDEAKADLQALNNAIACDEDIRKSYDHFIMPKLKPEALTALQQIAYDLALNNCDLSPKSYEGGASQRGITGDKRSIITGAAIAQVDATFPIQQGQLAVDERRFSLQQTNNADVRLSSAQLKAKFYDHDRNYKRARRDVTVGIMQAKYDAFSDAGGPLDYQSQLAELQQRQDIDVSEGYARLLAIRDGLEAIYDLSVPGFPIASPFSLESAISWVRRAGNELARLKLSEETFVVRLSLSRELGQSFKNDIDSGWTIALPADRFSGLCLIRLRGVAAHSYDNNGESFYELVVQAPSHDTAMVVYAGKQPQKLDPSSPQKYLETPANCRIGGVGPRSVFIQPDICGSEVLYNWSPIGIWKIQLTPGSAALARANQLRDLHLDLYLVVQAQK